MTDPATEPPERSWPVRFLKRWRAVLVLVPLLGGLLIAASIGAGWLWADVDRPVREPEGTCWDGETRPVAECTEPTGVAGLQWVFPGFRADRCDRVEAPPRKGREPALQFTCDTTFQERQVRIVYTERPSVGGAKAYLRKTFDGAKPSPVADGERLVYRDRGGDLGSRVAITYADFPFTVMLEAPGAAVRDNALKEFVRFRRVDQMKVRSED